MLLGARPPEMVEADLVQRLGRLVARDVAAELGRLGIRLQDDRDRVPADECRCQPLELAIARELGLLVDRDRVDVRRAEPGRDLDAEVLRVVDRLVEQVAHPLAAVGFDDRVDGLEPLAGLYRVDIRGLASHLRRTA